ncbi:MAG: nodulation protein NfeD [Candidatus Nitrohelix vancouverensis]|uniref:Nodulation protein NfeD n=1 Tax=Candidatus Nitrohelix vancouverensis TaxID=2705534 RepID=A0A7T0C2I4_9BACT|nr:MAG: nodulation protein NfeD [Candidatus Nitrohelix vancouverensis]
MYRDNFQPGSINQSCKGVEGFTTRIFGGHTLPALFSFLFSIPEKLLAALFIIVLFHTPAESLERVVVLEIFGPINPVVAAFVVEGIQQANDDGESLVVLQMDTPGGLDTSMREIIKAILNSQVPVATYVSPSGSRAASAGAFIAIASHVAAMAPGASIGAAHPVNMMGGDGGDKVMQSKIENDAAAYIRSLAEHHGRNADWAESAVRQSASLSAVDAEKQNVIDLVAGNLDALLLAIDGRLVKIGSMEKTLNTRGEVIFLELNKRQQILDAISNPNVVYILMMLGMVGLYFELSNPGLILPGSVGGVSLILALYGMQTLPIEYAGLLLIVLGMVFFIVELSVASSGLLAIGGTISIYFGSIMLIDSDDPSMQISKTVLYPTLALCVLLSIGILYLAERARELKAVSGLEGMLGSVGAARTEVNPTGTVMVHGEVWNAVSDERIEKGESVTIEAVDGLKLKVRKT